MTQAMSAMVLPAPHAPLVLEERPAPSPRAGEVRLKVEACGVCRTDLHVVDGELTQPKLPIIPGHEIVGRIDAIGLGVTGDSAWTAGRRPLARPYLRPLSPIA